MVERARCERNYGWTIRGSKHERNELRQATQKRKTRGHRHKTKRPLQMECHNSDIELWQSKQRTKPNQKWQRRDTGTKQLRKWDAKPKETNHDQVQIGTNHQVHGTLKRTTLQNVVKFPKASNYDTKTKTCHGGSDNTQTNAVKTKAMALNNGSNEQTSTLQVELWLDNHRLKSPDQTCGHEHTARQTHKIGCDDKRSE